MAAAAASMAAIRNREIREQSEAMDKEHEDFMRKVFEDLDADHSGNLGTDEVGAALKNMGLDEATTPISPKKRKLYQQQKEAKDMTFEQFKEFVRDLNNADQDGPSDKWSEPVSWLPHNAEVKKFYHRPVVENFVAAVIAFNFMAIIVEKEIDPYSEPYKQYVATWSSIDAVCNIIFTVELAVNLYGDFWRPFVRSIWNYLDSVVVVVGLLNMAQVDLGALSMLKMLRVVRIVRLFKKVKSLKQILVALLRSIPGVLNAFVLMFIAMSIFAIIGVEVFRDFAGLTGNYTTVQTYGPADATWGAGSIFADGRSVDPSVRFERFSDNSGITLRGFHFGQEYFGTFTRALYTLFQVMTGESWCEAVVRPLLLGDNPYNAVGVGLYFTAFVLIVGIILQNVVVTVLLDKFLSDSPEEMEEKKEEQTGQQAMLNKMKASSPTREGDADDAAGRLALSADPPSPSPSQPPPRVSRLDYATLNDAEFKWAHERAATLQDELAWTREQCDQIVRLLDMRDKQTNQENNAGAAGSKKDKDPASRVRVV